MHRIPPSLPNYVQGTAIRLSARRHEPAEDGGGGKERLIFGRATGSSSNHETRRAEAVGTARFPQLAPRSAHRLGSRSRLRARAASPSAGGGERGSTSRSEA